MCETVVWPPLTFNPTRLSLTMARSATMRCKAGSRVPASTSPTASTASPRPVKAAWISSSTWGSARLTLLDSRPKQRSSTSTLARDGPSR